VALPWLPNVYFSHTCPNRGRTRSETGVWFRSVSSYTCTGCSTRVNITYEEKLRLLCRDEKGDPDPKLDTSPLPSSDASAGGPRQAPEEKALGRRRS
jgi:hypothetical protein